MGAHDWEKDALSPGKFADEPRSIIDHIVEFATSLLDRPEIIVSVLSLMIALGAMLASWRSASAADQSAKASEVNERNSLARAALLGAHRIIATIDGVIRTANKLKIAYTTLYAHSAGTNSSSEGYYKRKIDETIDVMTKYSENAEGTIQHFQYDIDTEMMLKEVIRLEGILAQVSQVKEDITRELDEINHQNDAHLASKLR